jgi:tripartite-type tricarboxylate transporter receptor subunit TctC
MRSHIEVTHRRLCCAVLSSTIAIVTMSPSTVLPADPAYPTKTVRIVCAGAAGSSGDVRTRVIAEKLSARLGQRFVVENKPGAGTTIASALMLEAKPDGYTLLSTFTPSFAVAPMLYRSVHYDPVSSFTPIAFISRGSPFLIVHRSLPVNTLNEFVALAKAKPDTLSIAHGGVGGTNHLPAQLLMRAAGIRLLEVAYKSEAAALPDVIGGQVSAMFAYVSMAVPQIKGGNVRALAVAGAHRNAALPDVPTLAESGYPGFRFSAMAVLLGPPGLPKEIVTLLNREIAAALREPDVRASYDAAGSEPMFGSPQELASVIKSETEINGALVKDLGIYLEQ